MTRLFFALWLDWTKFSLWDSTSWQCRILLFRYQFCSWYPSYVFEYSSSPSCRFSGSTFHSTHSTPSSSRPPLSPLLPPLVYSCQEMFHLFLYFLVQVETTFLARYLSAKKNIYYVFYLSSFWTEPPSSYWLPGDNGGCHWKLDSKCCHSCRSSTPPNAELRILSKI